MEKHGIKELEEAVDLLIELLPLFMKLGADGIDLSDGIALVEEFKKRPELVEHIRKAVEGATKIPQEIGDISFKEAFDLGSKLVYALPRFFFGLLK